MYLRQGRTHFSVIQGYGSRVHGHLISHIVSRCIESFATTCRAGYGGLSFAV
jgi:hypothetical protein